MIRSVPSDVSISRSAESDESFHPMHVMMDLFVHREQSAHLTVTFQRKDMLFAVNQPKQNPIQQCPFLLVAVART